MLLQLVAVQKRLELLRRVSRSLILVAQAAWAAFEQILGTTQIVQDISDQFFHASHRVLCGLSQ